MHCTTSPSRTPDHLNRVLSKLKRVHQSDSNQWSACCPNHNDHDPSLSIALSDDERILLRCHAGCEADDIVDSIRLEMRDLFPRDSRKYIDFFRQDYLTNLIYRKRDDGRQEAVPVSLCYIVGRLSELTGGWPKRIDQKLFVDDEIHGVGFLDRPAHLFGYVQRATGKNVYWNSNQLGCVTKDELFCELQRTAPRFAAIETLPHQPYLAEHYYTHESERIRHTVSAGNRLDHLVDRFSPETKHDRELIKSAFMTPGWGGPPGERPAFVITSDDGRGVGKTTMAELVAALWGGSFAFSHNEQDVNKIKSRLLSGKEAMGKRVCLLDNIKSRRFSSSDFESLITAKSIGGHEYYTGEGSRPNHLTWFITVNGASFGTDISQRSVTIKIKRPAQHSPSWNNETRDFIEKHRAEIISEILDLLNDEDLITPLDSFSRWPTWEAEILQRLECPNEIQSLIRARQTASDVEQEEADLIERYFKTKLDTITKGNSKRKIFIPSRKATTWLNLALDRSDNSVSGPRFLNQLIGEGRLPRLAKSKNTAKRGFVWMGQNAESDLHIDYHLL